jgi:hypothetical protein
MRALLFAFLFFSLSSLLQAQVYPSALGLRFGGNGNVNGAEVSYQIQQGNNHRFELDFGLNGNNNHNRIFLAGIYHFHWNISGDLNWYLGPAASLGLYSASYKTQANFVIAAGMQAGLEYDFNGMRVPLLFTLDSRPMWDFIGDTDAGLGWGASLGIRYTF